MALVWGSCPVSHTPPRGLCPSHWAGDSQSSSLRTRGQRTFLGLRRGLSLEFRCSLWHAFWAWSRGSMWCAWVEDLGQTSIPLLLPVISHSLQDRPLGQGPSPSPDKLFLEAGEVPPRQGMLRPDPTGAGGHTLKLFQPSRWPSSSSDLRTPGAVLTKAGQGRMLLLAAASVLRLSCTGILSGAVRGCYGYTLPQPVTFLIVGGLPVLPGK